MQVVAFDLDGVILDSVEVVRAAYSVAGVTAPHDILSREGDRSWLNEQLIEQARKLRTSVTIVEDAVVTLKNAEYIRLIPYAKKLPGYDVARKLAREGVLTVLLTGAPRGTIDALRFNWAEWPFHNLSVDGLRTPVKMDILRGYLARGCYVDDQVNHVTCTTFGWRFVRYVGQTAEQLYREITE